MSSHSNECNSNEVDSVSPVDASVPVLAPTSSRKRTQSKSSRAGLSFPVGAIARHMREGRDASGRVATHAAVYHTAAIEYVIALLLEKSAKKAISTVVVSTTDVTNIPRITQRHIDLVIDEMPDLRRLLRRRPVLRPLC